MFLSYGFLNSKKKITYSNFAFLELLTKRCLVSVYVELVRTIQWFFDKFLSEGVYLANGLTAWVVATSAPTTTALTEVSYALTYVIVLAGLLF